MNGYVPSPRPHPRIKPEAQENASRNRGGMEKWFDYEHNIADYNSPRPGDRITSSEAKQNAQTNKGTVKQFMGGYPDPPIKRDLHPRGVSSVGAENATNNKGAGMKNLIDNYGNLGLSDRPHPKVIGADASEYAERNAGEVSGILNNYGHHAPPPQPAAKVSYGGQEVANKHKGQDMAPLLQMENNQTSPRDAKQGRLHQESDGASWDETPPHIRVRPEAEGIICKNSKSELGDIMKGVKSPDEKNQRSKNIKHLTESEVTRPRTSPARTRPEAMQYYNRNNVSEMGAIMGGKPSTNGVADNTHYNKMLKKSEDW